MTETRAEFDEFVRARYERLCRTAYLLCGDWQHGEDLVQTTLAKAYVAHRRGRIDSLDAYVHRALVTTQVSWWRRRWHGEVATGELPEHPDADAYGAADRRDAVVRALATLPAAARAVLVLRYFADLPEAECARLLNCSVGTVKSRASRALATLRASGVLTEEVDHHA
ncbi:MAG TPA: SigE family RNA polymerase sigma factor [Frankiaceae bacterium]|nr:SigE family RNA polymerase sigma factor [Frankiaceae bacterium]